LRPLGYDSPDGRRVATGRLLIDARVLGPLGRSRTGSGQEAPAPATTYDGSAHAYLSLGMKVLIHPRDKPV
jgi:hypothetical protein